MATGNKLKYRGSAKNVPGLFLCVDREVTFHPIVAIEAFLAENRAVTGRPMKRRSKDEWTPGPKQAVPVGPYGGGQPRVIPPG